MKLIHLYNLLLLITVSSLPYSSFAQERPLLSITVNESSYQQQRDEDLSRPEIQNESRILPIWGNEARARGYELPEPFGIGYGYMNLRQDVVVDKIAFIFPKNPLIAESTKIKAGHTREKNESHMLKLDTWILPFLNVYGVYGKTKGSSKTTIDNVTFSGIDLPFAKGTPFVLDFEGKTYGGGAVLAGSYKQFFATLDANYTRTNLDILDGDISALVITPRIGYEFTFQPLLSEQGSTKVQVWVGAMYQDITQRFKGNINNLNLPEPFASLIRSLDDTGMKFDVKQHLAHKWNNTIGTRIEITRNFNILSEVGFSNRNSFYISGELRF
ncbi:MAG: hypothetical protein AB8W37_10330 [Arsenophonus endosymbiont of Dermacentor nuttalli]